MPFIKQERRRDIIVGTMPVDDIEPGDRCFVFYRRLVVAWRSKPRWSTVHELYKRHLRELVVLSLEDEAAAKLAWQVFFALEVLPYEQQKRIENGEVY